MIAWVRSVFAQLFEVRQEERVKVVLLALTFGLIIAGYAAAKELKDTVFMAIVGRDYIPLARTLALFAMIPPIYLYAKIVDRLRPYHVLTACSLFFGLIGLIFAYYIGDPGIGITNTDTGPNRLFGWLLYFFVEGYTPFLVSVFWAVANSVNNPMAARENYGLIVSGSKVGGLLSSGLAWWLFSWASSLADPSAYDVFTHQAVFAISSLIILLVPVCIHLLVKHVPKKQLHGYEAAYQVEKQRRKAGEARTGFFAGLKVFLKYPYVLGIFGMVFFFEVITTVVSFLRLGEAGANATSVSRVTSYLFKTIFIMHVVTLLISVLGTRPLFKLLGERVCLLLIPTASAVVLVYFMFNMTPGALILTYTTLKAINFAFSWPVRESLYIPTVKDIRFKAKSWIDVFGTKFAKTTGSAFNYTFITGAMIPATLLPPLVGFVVPVMLLWTGTAYLLGIRYDRAVRNNEVIGYDEAAASDTGAGAS